jgi:hypothetical protein
VVRCLMCFDCLFGEMFLDCQAAIFMRRGSLLACAEFASLTGLGSTGAATDRQYLFYGWFPHRRIVPAFTAQKLFSFAHSLGRANIVLLLCTVFSIFTW